MDVLGPPQQIRGTVDKYLGYLLGHRRQMGSKATKIKARQSFGFSLFLILFGRRRDIRARVGVGAWRLSS